MAYRIGTENRKTIIDRAFGMIEALDLCRTITGKPELGRIAEEQVINAVLFDLEVSSGIGDVDAIVRQKLIEADSELQQILKRSGEQESCD